MKKQMKETRSLKINNIIKYICIFIVMLMLTSCNCKKDKGHNHPLSHIDKVEATCTTEGVLEHYKCTSCGKYFLDELGKTEIKDISISKLGHNYDMSNIKWEWSKNYEEVVTTLICKNDKAHQEKIQAVVTKEENADAVTYKATITYNNLEYTDIKRETSVLEYELSQDETSYIVTGIGKCKDSNIIIPSEYHGLPVKSIKYDAFRGCSNLTSITIPNSVTSIGDSAFRSCSSLTSITIPFVGSTLEGTSNTHFGYIFGAATSSDNKKYVPDSLKEVIITSGTSIGDYAFRSCSSLINVYYDGTIEDWCKIKFSYQDSNPMNPAEHFYIKNTNNEYDEVTEIIISNVNISIGDYQFYSFDNIINVEIPNSVTSIGDSAFESCSSLTSIIIPDSVTDIGGQAFYGCSSLATMMIPAYAIEYLPKGNLQEVIITSGTSIGDSAFESCSSLTIYCEVTSKPSGWSLSWNESNRPVVWG